MKVSDYIVNFLLEQGIDKGFFLHGGMITPIGDSCYRLGLKLFTVHHEQAASFAAEAQSATTGKIGFAMGTSGPGATNMVTGIASAYFGSIPVLFITGQVNTGEANKNRKRRQAGFQELDIVTLVSSITKYAKLIYDSKMIPFELEKAAFIAKNKRMGPVLLDIPIDMQQAELNPNDVKHFFGSSEHKELIKEEFTQMPDFFKIANLLNQSHRPIILIGHGVKLSHSESLVNKLVNITGIPFVTSLLGTDSISNSHPNCYGFIGTYGKRYSNFAVANSDLILVLGSRLDNRQIGVQAKLFAPQAKIIHVDIDENELNQSVEEFMSIHSNLNEFVKSLLPFLTRNPNLEEWITFLKSLKEKYNKEEQSVGPNEIDPINIIKLISYKYPNDGIITVDVGANQMWFAHGWEVKDGQTILTNGGMAPMGYSLPAAIGASIANGNQQVLVIAGDGGLQINIQEFQTIVRNKLPIKIVVLNNNSLGMITQFQTENFEGRLTGTVPALGYNAPNFAKVSRAYGIHSKRITTPEEVLGSVDWLLNNKSASLLDVIIPSSYFTLPKSRFTYAVHDMMPFLDRKEFERATKYLQERKVNLGE